MSKLPMELLLEEIEVEKLRIVNSESICELPKEYTCGYMQALLFVENEIHNQGLLIEQEMFAIKLKDPKLIRYKCLLCGRDKFTRKSPHNCNSGFRKHKIQWEIIQP